SNKFLHFLVPPFLPDFHVIPPGDHMRKTYSFIYVILQDLLKFLPREFANQNNAQSSHIRLYSSGAALAVPINRQLVARRPRQPTSNTVGTQDLLGRLRVSQCYEVHVLPFVRPAGDAPPEPNKGKGKEVVPSPTQSARPSSSRIPHGLKGFLNDLPGKTSTKKGPSIVELMMVPPKQRADIASFDARTLEHFRLPEGQLLYRNPSALDPDHEVKKKRKKKRPEGGTVESQLPGGALSGPSASSPVPPTIPTISDATRLGNSPHGNGPGSNPRVRRDWDQEHPGNTLLSAARPPKKRKLVCRTAVTTANTARNRLTYSLWTRVLRVLPSVPPELVSALLAEGNGTGRRRCGILGRAPGEYLLALNVLAGGSSGAR
ncbi:hypothetical protein BS47DRAFT_1340263, partial [Hydnum rufescens UP504]